MRTTFVLLDIFVETGGGRYISRNVSSGRDFEQSSLSWLLFRNAVREARSTDLSYCHFIGLEGLHTDIHIFSSIFVNTVI